MPSSVKVKSHDVVSQDLEIARSLFAAGDYGEVVTFVEAAISHARNDRERFALLLLRASAFGEKQEYEKSFDALEGAGVIIDQASGMSRARFYCQRAYLHVKLGNSDGALVDYAEAGFWAHEAGDRITEATARNNISMQYNNAGRLEEALAESDIAISIGIELGSDWRLGRYHDQRAQILVDNHRFAEALNHSERAITLLVDNPSLIEAQETYERAVVGLFLKFSDRNDPIESFCARRSALQRIPDDLDRDTARSALERSKGHVSKAAALLKITHGALLKAIKRHGLQDLQQRKHNRKIFKKPALIK